MANEFRAPNAATLGEQFALAFTNRRIVYAGESPRHKTARREFPKLVAIRAAAEQLRSFYAEGTKSCILDLLSIPSDGPELAAGLKGALQAWQKAFAEIPQESGYGPGEARRRSEDAVMRIEGSLVLSRVLNDSKPFHRALDELGSTLLQPASSRKVLKNPEL